MSVFLAIPEAAWVCANALAFAFRDRFPVSPGHTLIVTRRVTPDWFTATDDERAAVLALLAEVKRQLDEELAPAGYNVGFNAGEVAGQTVMHLHGDDDPFSGHEGSSRRMDPGDHGLLPDVPWELSSRDDMDREADARKLSLSHGSVPRMRDSDVPDVPAFSVRKKQEDTWLTGERLSELQDEIRQVYLSDQRPWVIGFSGGKDSTAALQLIWYAIAKLPKEQRQKRIYVIASDTLVETPVIVGHITRALKRINEVSAAQDLPFSADLVRPKVTDTFWVNMIGKGYPAPYRRFRWCTDRLKIQPANVFIENRVVQHGEVVLVLGVRRGESATRAQVMALHRKQGERLSRHSSLRSAWVYTPVEHFTTNDVWTYLLSAPNPWGSNNRDLVTMYRNAQAGECPLVVDTTTPSCGGGRFGCWTCTVVERDKSMEAMIDSGEEWMEPLLEVRNWLSKTSEPATKHRYREVRRRNGNIQIWGDDDNKKIVWGPYKLDIRREILRRVLAAQTLVRKNGPDPSVSLITDDELGEIRRLWRTEEGDWEDSLPKIYREEVGADLDWVMDDTITSSALDASVLAEVCAEASLPLVMLRELIDYERELQGLGRRQGVYEKIDGILSKDWRTPEQVFTEINYKPENELDEGTEVEDAP